MEIFLTLDFLFWHSVQARETRRCFVDESVSRYRILDPLSLGRSSRRVFFGITGLGAWQALRGERGLGLRVCFEAENLGESVRTKDSGEPVALFVLLSSLVAILFVC